MGRSLISDELINLIRDRVDIAEVIGQHVNLTRAGQNLKGLCPFHQEKTASFSVSPSRQIFHCFGCGAGGNVFTFLTRITGATFPDTVRELGRRVGIEVPHVVEGRPDHQAAQMARLECIHVAAAEWYRSNLSDAQTGRQARAYLCERGIQDETIMRFGLGFAPADGLARALAKQGFHGEELAQAGLVATREPDTPRAIYDRFRRRVMFPIVDLRKRIVGFGGRTIGTDTPKYLNSPETPLFKKGHTLFALDLAREAAGQSNTCIIVEGYFDAVVMHQAGIRNVVATLGTALTAEHIQTIRRFAAHVVLLFDPDTAGVRAALRGLDLFVNSGLSVKVVSLPNDLDPDAYVRQHAADGFYRLLERAPTLLDFAVEHSVQTAQTGSIEDRIRSVDEILRIIQKGEHPIEREERIRRVADRLGMNHQRLIERYQSVSGRTKHGGLASAASGAPKAKQHPEERDLVYLMLHGHLSAADLARVVPDLFVLPLYRRVVDIALQHGRVNGDFSVQRTLDALLADADCAALATELSLLDQHFDDMPTHIRDCLDRLERKHRETELQRLILELKTAECERRDEDVRRLNVRINELRMRKAGTRLPASTPQ